MLCLFESLISKGINFGRRLLTCRQLPLLLALLAALSMLPALAFVIIVLARHMRRGRTR